MPDTDDDVTRLAEQWAGRTGKHVTVFTAAEAVCDGQPVWPCGDTEVRPASGRGQVYGRALHDAGAGELVAVLPEAGEPDA